MTWRGSAFRLFSNCITIASGMKLTYIVVHLNCHVLSGQGKLDEDLALDPRPQRVCFRGRQPWPSGNSEPLCPLYSSSSVGRQYLLGREWSPAGVRGGTTREASGHQRSRLKFSVVFLSTSTFASFCIVSAIGALNIINFLMFVMETRCVFCLVGVEFILIIYVNFEWLN